MPTAKKTPVKKAEVKVAPVKPVAKSASGLSVEVLSLLGKPSGSLALPKEVFGAKINKSLMSQAVRIYLTNASSHHSHTKTRGEVEGSTRKVYRQKGTGRARHGGIRAPIYVGGGIALGPKSRKTTLDLPQKMKNAALISALSEKVKEGRAMGISGLDKASGKSREMAALVRVIDKKSLLLIIDGKLDNAKRAARNIPGLNLSTADELNVLEVIKHGSLILTKEAVEKLTTRLTQPKKGNIENA